MSGGGLAKHCDEDIGAREFQCSKSTKSGDKNSKKPLPRLDTVTFICHSLSQTPF